MHLLILGSQQNWYTRDLKRSAADQHTITVCNFNELTSAVDTSGVRTRARDMDLATVDRLLVRTMPPGSLEQVVFRMDVLRQLEESGLVVVNPAEALESAVDKYLTTAKLARAGLLVPRTIACQTVDEAMAAFQILGGDVVVKPLFGGEGRGIARIEDEALALRAAKMLAGLGAVIYLQEFIPHEGFDLRLLVVGQKVLGMRRRQHGSEWRTNISQGAHAEPLRVSSELAHTARRAASVVGASLAGVDLLAGRDGSLYTLEVNAVPGWRALDQTVDLDVARLVLDHLEGVTIRPPGP